MKISVGPSPAPCNFACMSEYASRTLVLACCKTFAWRVGSDSTREHSAAENSSLTNERQSLGSLTQGLIAPSEVKLLVVVIAVEIEVVVALSVVVSEHSRKTQHVCRTTQLPGLTSPVWTGKQTHLS